MGSVLFSRHAHTVRKCQVVGALVCCQKREGRTLINMVTCSVMASLLIRMPYCTRQYTPRPVCLVQYPLHLTTTGEISPQQWCAIQFGSRPPDGRIQLVARQWWILHPGVAWHANCYAEAERESLSCEAEGEDQGGA